MPGQTYGRASRPSGGWDFNGGPDNCPAKPDRSGVVAHRSRSLQWRAGQLPGQTGAAWRSAPRVIGLQWRAGQLPGQTGQNENQRPPASELQWRAGQLPGQTVSSRSSTRHSIRTSMEGRTIARPNPLEERAAGPPGVLLQWRAGQLPGQTPVIWYDTAMLCRDFNGGPDNCPAKPRRGRGV